MLDMRMRIEKPLAFLLQPYGARETEGILEKVSNFTFTPIHMLVTKSVLFPSPTSNMKIRHFLRRNLQGEK